MKTSLLKYAVCGLLAVAVVGAPLSSVAQESKAPEKKAPVAGEKKKNGFPPFRGKLDAVDKTAKTIKVGERTFQITSETRLTKGDKEATLDDAVVGEDVGGQYDKVGDKLVAKSVRFGPKPEGSGKKGEGKKKKE